MRIHVLGLRRWDLKTGYRWDRPQTMSFGSRNLGVPGRLFEGCSRVLKTVKGSKMDYELEMARRSYGYGRWDAPYWFIGPEQGKGRAEPSGNSQRVNAWRKLGENELCDCLDFHEI